MTGEIKDNRLPTLLDRAVPHDVDCLGCEQCGVPIPTWRETLREEHLLTEEHALAVLDAELPAWRTLWERPPGKLLDGQTYIVDWELQQYIARHKPAADGDDEEGAILL